MGTEKDFNTSVFEISIFKNKTDEQPEPFTLDWQELVQMLSEHEVRAKKDGLAFSGAKYAPGTTRANHNVIELSLAVLDVDDGNKEMVIANCQRLRWPCVIYSTFKNSSGNRFRVVVLPSRPIKPAEWRKVWAAMCHMLGTKADTSARDESRIFYTPCCPEANKAHKFVFIESGDAPMDVDALLLANIPDAPHTSGKGSSSEVQTYREIAEAVRANLFTGPVWYYHENFRMYENGYWRQLDMKVDVMKEILKFAPDISASGVREVTETLKLLLADHANETADDASNEHARLPNRLICLSNGTLDPTTGELRPHSPYPRLLSGLPTPWIPEAKAPRFLEFLREIWGSEPDYHQRVIFLQDFMGYLLYPSNKFETFVWFTGHGANGKSVLLRVMADLVGRENTTWAMLDRLSVPAVRTTLEGKHLNISTEMNVQATQADGYLKSITSGEEVEADPKWKESYSFRPYVKLVAATNHLPHLKDHSEGFARRAVILSFNRIFETHERDSSLAEKLAEERAGILAFAVVGLQRLLKRGGFERPPSSLEHVATYRVESDAVAVFHRDFLVSCDTGTSVGDLYAAYREFCTTNGFHPRNSAQFGRRLTELGIATLRKSSGKPIRACKLISQRQEDTIQPRSDAGDKIVDIRKKHKISIEEAFNDDEIAVAQG
ncbi:DNA primase family protein [Noviherbaspirillum denitrificans]|uniref:SF3 helicase domain-containing protein n=1 Tax=Noviherbaspirillum denitrificans TaxID=1968433 RepID=A0A254TCU1_9BURK|nr:phage/plasmid primase, P4 family [Noviherbaspirillum denitrificans]OWW18363.1 hypothetical protein AYR66_01205 [Noviherbaspirillum denitrificans]